MKPIQDATTKILEGRRQRLMRKRAVLIAEQRAVAAELDQRYRDAALRKDLEAVQRKHDVQLVHPQGIESQEAVNGE